MRGKGLQRRKGKIGVMDFGRGSNRIRNSKYTSLLYTYSTPPLLIKSSKTVRQLIPQLSDDFHTPARSVIRPGDCLTPPKPRSQIQHFKTLQNMYGK
jgi:hypothetical protein